MFPICVSVGGLGLQLFDKLYGTDFTPAYLDWLDYGARNWIAAARTRTARSSGASRITTGT